jgi:hypothetical protein
VKTAVVESHVEGSGKRIKLRVSRNTGSCLVMVAGEKSTPFHLTPCCATYRENLPVPQPRSSRLRKNRENGPPPINADQKPEFDPPCSAFICLPTILVNETARFILSGE